MTSLLDRSDKLDDFSLKNELERFNEIVLDSIDYGLRLLGDESMRVIYFYLERNYHLKREKIPMKIDIFTEALEKMFGAGSYVIERSITKKLYSQVDLDYGENEKPTLKGAIAKAKRSLFPLKNTFAKTTALSVQHNGLALCQFFPLRNVILIFHKISIFYVVEFHVKLRVEPTRACFSQDMRRPSRISSLSGL